MVLNWIPETPHDHPDRQIYESRYLYIHTALKGCQAAYAISLTYTIARKLFKKESLKRNILTTFPRTLKYSTLIGIAVANGITHQIIHNTPEKRKEVVAKLRNCPEQNLLDDYMLMGWVMGGLFSLTSSKFSFINSVLTGGCVSVIGYAINEIGLEPYGYNIPLNFLKCKDL